MELGTEPAVGERLALPYLGPDRYGDIVDIAWSQSLGTIVRIERHGLFLASDLLYGYRLEEAIAASKAS